MPVRTGSAVWEGDLRQGQGTVRLGSGGYEGRYSFASRFEEGQGTNPEELIGAAHAGCFSMQLSGNLGRAGHPPKRIQTTARVHVDRAGEGWKITTIELQTEAEVPGLDDKTFQEAAEAAKRGCPVSQALTGVEIRLQARLAA